MSAVEAKLRQYAQLLEEELQRCLPVCPSPESTVSNAMAYSLLGGGKRIRGVLTLAFYQLFQEDVTPALPYASALEMVHAYSLIHDDLPCMDDDDLRRGKPSCHIAHGEATALLAGDGLLTLAFETMADPKHAASFKPDTAIQAMYCLSSAAGCGGMIGGQAIDLYQEGKPFSQELMERTYEKKTGALLIAGGSLGCILAETGEAVRNAAVDYCRNIGLAFQIVDDILDMTGNSAVLGKPIGSDAQNQKNTWAGRYGIQAAQQEVARLNQQAKQALERIPADTEFLAGLADLLARRNN